MRLLALKQRIVFAAPIILLWAGAAGCEGRRGDAVRLSSDVRRPERSVVIFFVDGMDRGRLDTMLAAGLLPSISQHFVEGGVEVKHAIASMPSLTYPNSVSLITGVFPGHHGILGNQWFDRSSLKYQDYASASTYRNVNEDFTTTTLYEILADNFTVNVQCHTRRGVTHTIDNWAMTGIDLFFGKRLRIDRRVGQAIPKVAEAANRIGHWPTVLLLYFPGVDMTGHRWGAASQQYTAAVRNLDAQVGHVIRTLHGAGIDESTYFVLLSDHGHTPYAPGNVFDLVEWLRRQCGLRILQERVGFEYNPDAFALLHRFDAAVVNGVYRRVVIHLKGPLGWASPATKADILRVIEGATPNGNQLHPAPETSDKQASRRSEPGVTAVDHPSALYEQPGVGLVCVRDGPNRVKVFSRAGSCIVERRTGQAAQASSVRLGSDLAPVSDGAQVANGAPASNVALASAAVSVPAVAPASAVAPVSNRCDRSPRQYRLLYPQADASQAATDPLGYLKTKPLAVFVAEGWHGSRAWLAATAASDFPDFVPQVVEMFDSRRAGDIVVFAEDDWTFNSDEPSGHGSCSAADMRVPLYFAGPGLPAGGRINHARLVDLMPTVLDLLGKAARLNEIGPIDGVSIAAELKAAQPKAIPADAESVEGSDQG